ncbi:DUF5597 domain-containing protein [Occallatibacter riparius]|uniref:DUF5597 domain-containing protein n=1 Tax=Occallatibacter riparius TaxID=1002689 RepID=A0A9J7BUM0_9BACT|nr:DUF5597 domain-containing protein [Occallatibacter riparius]UWZ85450.1 DUF5597 domain-containing protein [Occallatibacter riparius]
MMKPSCLFAALLLACPCLALAQKTPAGVHPIPSIAEKDGRFALMVDGSPYLMLGFQANNSSAWPATFDKVFPAAAILHANTIELPVYWEQFEATPGHYDYSNVDAMLVQARAHHVRLVLLWFGTWKNGSSHYTPQWIKQDQQKYPFLVNKDGDTVDSPSTFSPARLEADRHAFAALMRHLRTADPQRTVLMVQVENEAGVWHGIRDYRPEAEKEFAGQVPQKLVDALGKQPGTWRQVFGDAADETFQAWCIATYIEQVAAAGKAEYALPLYTNAALRDPINPGLPGSYESGAPTDQNVQFYKIAAPSLSVIAPDIYMPEYAKYMAVIDQYKRFKNPLLIPETGNAPIYAHYVFAAIGQGAIGFAPFGLDLTAYSNLTEGAEAMGDKSAAGPETRLAPFANEYALLEPIASRLAQANLEGNLRGSSEDPNAHTQTLDFPRWQVDLSYGLPAFGNWIKPKGNNPPDGGAVIVALGPDEFLVTGHHVRVDFTPKFDKAKKRFFLVVEEGNYDASGKWQMKRLWNGDQTDYGLNLIANANYLLRVKLTTY